MRNRLTIPPRIRTLGEEHERHASWLELFYDLVFVAAIAQLALMLGKMYQPGGLLGFTVVFIPVWWAWVGQTMYLTRFDTDDLSHRLVTMVQMLAVASLAVFIPDALGSGLQGFALSYAVVRAILVFEYLRAGHHNPLARALTLRYALGFGIAAGLWVVSAFVPAPYAFILWGAAILVDVSIPLLTPTAMQAAVPPHYAHVPERFGLFTILVLGESIIAAVAGTSQAAFQVETAIAGALGFITIFMLWWGYFDGANAAAERRVAGPRDVRRYLAWLYCHLPLTLAIVLVAVGIKKVTGLSPEGEMTPYVGWILCGGLTLAMLALNALSILNPNSPPNLRKHLLPHWVLNGLTLLAGFLTYLPGPIWLMAGLAACATGHIVVLLYRKATAPPPVLVPSEI